MLLLLILILVRGVGFHRLVFEWGCLVGVEGFVGFVFSVSVFW